MCNYNSQLAAGYFYRGIHTCTCILYIVHNKLTIYAFNYVGSFYNYVGSNFIIGGEI